MFVVVDPETISDDVTIGEVFLFQLFQRDVRVQTVEPIPIPSGLTQIPEYADVVIQIQPGNIPGVREQSRVVDRDHLHTTYGHGC